MLHLKDRIDYFKKNYDGTPESREHCIQLLQQEGSSVIEGIAVVRAVLQISMTEAKELVTASGVWDKEVTDITEALAEAMKQAEEESRQCNGIVFKESFLLGWNYTQDALILYCNCMLEQSHPQWQPAQPGLAGCYKLVKIYFEGVTHCSTITQWLHLPLWNNSAGGYLDLGKIKEFVTDMSDAVIKADNFYAKFDYQQMRIEVSDTQRFNK